MGRHRFRLRRASRVLGQIVNNGWSLSLPKCTSYQNIDSITAELRSEKTITADFGNVQNPLFYFDLSQGLNPLGRQAGGNSDLLYRNA